jgi:hypothetical protein
MQYSYSLSKGFGIGAERCREIEKIFCVTGGLRSITANTGAGVARITAPPSGVIKHQLRTRLAGRSENCHPGCEANNVSRENVAERCLLL